MPTRPVVYAPVSAPRRSRFAVARCARGSARATDTVAIRHRQPARTMEGAREICSRPRRSRRQLDAVDRRRRPAAARAGVRDGTRAIWPRDRRSPIGSAFSASARTCRTCSAPPTFTVSRIPAPEPFGHRVRGSASCRAAGRHERRRRRARDRDARVRRAGAAGRPRRRSRDALASISSRAASGAPASAPAGPARARELCDPARQLASLESALAARGRGLPRDGDCRRRRSPRAAVARPRRRAPFTRWSRGCWRPASASGVLADVGCGTGDLARDAARHDSTASSASMPSATTGCRRT